MSNKNEIVVPRMGESITEATVGAFLKQTGDKVKAEEEIVEIETDKVNQVLYAPSAGVLKWQVEQGAKVKIGDVLGVVEAGEVESASPKKPLEAPAPEKKKEAKKDIPVQPPPPKKEEPAKPSSVRETRQKLSQVRKVIGKRMVEAQRQTASLTTFNEADMSEIIHLRDKYKDLFFKEHQVKLGFMPFFIKAAVSALHAFSEVNAYLEGEELVLRHYFDIGVAVSTEQGVIVPILKNCDQLPFAEIEKKLAEYAKQARTGNISLQDLEGGGFTITNGGVFGSLFSTPILNPPQAAILGMHKIVQRPVAIEEKVEIRPMMYLALTYDHRVIDGKEAVSFLLHIKEKLEDPSRMQLEI
jgi:2-oxoglutarate dehydrogenase E2 component (dihydrolipoamide succinyltransferase)